MKRFILSMGALLLCCTVLFTGCSSVTTTIEYNDGSQTVEIDIDQRQEIKLASVSESFEPGFSTTATLSFKNIGDHVLFHSFTLTNFKHNSGGDLAEVLKVYDTSLNKTCNSSNYLGTVKELTKRGYLVDYVLITGLEIAHEYPGDLNGAYERTLELTFVMDETAGNEYKSANGPVQCSFDINLHAIKP